MPTLFKYISDYPCSPEELFCWHSRPGALERLLPPWERTVILAQRGGIDPGGEVVLNMYFGPFPFRFHARHLDHVPGKMFRDIQEKGPFARWSHSHFFEQLPQGARLRDMVEYALPGEAFVPKFFKTFVQKNLQTLFRHRESVLREDLLLHKHCSHRPMRLLVTGASGALGQDLLPLLTSGGHQVITLVRRPPDPAKNEIYWDPAQSILAAGDLPELDGVIHLAGEYIGLARWDDAKKRRVIDSRVHGTNLLARTLAALPKPPRVFLSASAVGYYGDCGDQVVDETAPAGNGFISEVCAAWEQATAIARNAGIRTVLMRLGVGLTPKGGALQRVMSSSSCGCISRFGSGRQFISWISSDDMISAMLHALASPTLAGPVNIAAPHPVTNQEFLRTFAQIVGRPLICPISAALLQIIYGQMAKEIVLSSCQVSVKKLESSGFRFRHPDLDTALRHLLGKSLAKPTNGNTTHML